MGQKVNPISFRTSANIERLRGKWFAKNAEYGDFAVVDYMIRRYFKRPETFEKKKALKEGKREAIRSLGISKLEILRKNSGSDIEVVLCANRPGLLMDKLPEIKNDLLTLLSKFGKHHSAIKSSDFKVNVVVKEDPFANISAAVVAENVAMQLEKRIAFRRAMRLVVRNTMSPKNGPKATGIKVIVSGRLGGADIARAEKMSEGSISLHTISKDIDYATAEAQTTYGIIGVKVWVNLGGSSLSKKQNSRVE